MIKVKYKGAQRDLKKEVHMKKKLSKKSLYHLMQIGKYSCMTGLILILGLTYYRHNSEAIISRYSTLSEDNISSDEDNTGSDKDNTGSDKDADFSNRNETADNDDLSGSEYIDNGNSSSNRANDNSAELININTASKEELMQITGIGEARARLIIDYRENVSEFACIEDIMNVSGIKSATFEKIKAYICVKG